MWEQIIELVSLFLVVLVMVDDIVVVVECYDVVAVVAVVATQYPTPKYLGQLIILNTTS